MKWMLRHASLTTVIVFSVAAFSCLWFCGVFCWGDTTDDASCCHGSGSSRCEALMDVRGMSNYFPTWRRRNCGCICKATITREGEIMKKKKEKKKVRVIWSPPLSLRLMNFLFGLIFATRLLSLSGRAWIGSRRGRGWCYTMTAERDFTHHCRADSSRWKIQRFCRHKKSTCPSGSVSRPTDNPAARS